jgi:hypothetical protein
LQRAITELRRAVGLDAVGDGGRAAVEAAGMASGTGAAGEPGLPVPLPGTDEGTVTVNGRVFRRVPMLNLAVSLPEGGVALVRRGTRRLNRGISRGIGRGTSFRTAGSRSRDGPRPLGESLSGTSVRSPRESPRSRGAGSARQGGALLTSPPSTAGRRWTMRRDASGADTIASGPSVGRAALEAGFAGPADQSFERDVILAALEWRDITLGVELLTPELVGVDTKAVRQAQAAREKHERHARLAAMSAAGGGTRGSGGAAGGGQVTPQPASNAEMAAAAAALSSSATEDDTPMPAVRVRARIQDVFVVDTVTKARHTYYLLRRTREGVKAASTRDVQAALATEAAEAEANAGASWPRDMSPANLARAKEQAQLQLLASVAEGNEEEGDTGAANDTISATTDFDEEDEDEAEDEAQAVLDAAAANACAPASPLLLLDARLYHSGGPDIDVLLEAQRLDLSLSLAPLPPLMRFFAAPADAQVATVTDPLLEAARAAGEQLNAAVAQQLALARTMATLPSMRLDLRVRGPRLLVPLDPCASLTSVLLVCLGDITASSRELEQRSGEGARHGRLLRAHSDAFGSSRASSPQPAQRGTSASDSSVWETRAQGQETRTHYDALQLEVHSMYAALMVADPAHVPLLLRAESLPLWSRTMGGRGASRGTDYQRPLAALQPMPSTGRAAAADSAAQPQPEAEAALFLGESPMLLLPTHVTVGLHMAHHQGLTQGGLARARVHVRVPELHVAMTSTKLRHVLALAAAMGEMAAAGAPSPAPAAPTAADTGAAAAAAAGGTKIACPDLSFIQESLSSVGQGLCGTAAAFGGAPLPGGAVMIAHWLALRLRLDALRLSLATSAGDIGPAPAPFKAAAAGTRAAQAATGGADERCVAALPGSWRGVDYSQVFGTRCRPLLSLFVRDTALSADVTSAGVSAELAVATLGVDDLLRVQLSGWAQHEAGEGSPDSEVRPIHPREFCSLLASHPLQPKDGQARGRGAAGEPLPAIRLAFGLDDGKLPGHTPATTTVVVEVGGLTIILNQDTVREVLRLAGSQPSQDAYTARLVQLAQQRRKRYERRLRQLQDECFAEAHPVDGSTQTTPRTAAAGGLPAVSDRTATVMTPHVPPQAGKRDGERGEGAAQPRRLGQLAVRPPQARSRPRAAGLPPCRPPGL